MYNQLNRIYIWKGETEKRQTHKVWALEKDCVMLANTKAFALCRYIKYEKQEENHQHNRTSFIVMIMTYTM